MFRAINNIVEGQLVSIAKDILKPSILTADSGLMKWFQNDYSPQKNVKNITVTSEERKLTAHTIQINASEKEDSYKVALIYMCGNGEYVAHALPALETVCNDIITEAKKTQDNFEYAIYCQDYRGKGFNQSNDIENFNDYPLFQDAKDQAALIRSLLDQGYFPENIFIIGHSLGSAVALWAVDILRQEFNPECKNIKVFCDRGYGNLLDFPFVRPFLTDQAQTHSKLWSSGMMPQASLHDIARGLENSFILCAENDGVISSAISLFATFQKNEIQGRKWISEASKEQKGNPHNLPFSSLGSRGIPEIKPHHFMTAIIHQIPIKLKFDFILPEKKGYALSKNAKIGDDDFVEIPEVMHEISDIASMEAKEITSNQTNSIVIPVKDTLVMQLHDYLIRRSEEAITSGYGSSYKRGLFGLVGWTIKEQIQMAVRLMLALCGDHGPDLDVLTQLMSEDGPHKSGALNIIFEKIVALIADMEQIRFFNQWIESMPEQQKKIEKKAVDPEENCSFSFFKPVLVGLGTVIGGMATYGIGGAAIGAITGYMLPDVVDSMQSCCKKI